MFSAKNLQKDSPGLAEVMIKCTCTENTTFQWGFGSVCTRMLSPHQHSKDFSGSAAPEPEIVVCGCVLSISRAANFTRNRDPEVKSDTLQPQGH